MLPASGDEPLSGHPWPLLYNVVYCSRAAEGVDDAVIQNIVAWSHRNNPVRGITGMLVFGSGIFFQWLEGPRDTVQELLTTLKKDLRHNTIVVLAETEEVRERAFPDWAMELVTALDIQDVLLDAQSNAKDASNAKALGMLLQELQTGVLTGLNES